jgi:winged helix DNA-binding protein
MGEDEGVAAARLESQLLTSSSARSPEEVVARLLAVQAQDPRGARLSVRSRSSGLLAADVDRALTVDRTLVVTWLNRGTLHLVNAADYWWLHPLTTPQLVAANERRLRQAGVSRDATERGIASITEAITTFGPRTRTQLAQHLYDAGIPTAGQALYHVLFAASARGHVVRGPVVGRESAFVSVAEWLGQPPPSFDRDEALGLLARRYLAGHGPASASDLAQWAKLPLRDVRRGLDVIGSELAAMGDDVHLAHQSSGTRLPAPRLLGPFDPVLHGYASRRFVLGTHTRLVTTNGIFRPVVLVDGRAVGTWRLEGAAIEIVLFDSVSVGATDQLVRDSRDVFRYLGLPESPPTVTRA